ncbi:MAG: LysM peptidoglycan-binding domain-containing protein [Flavobacteriaceae bacterium]|nr:LysM peptidoglycan-binding domain-containing protein [Flavobacteriaceae bacterium]MDH3795248.1 LysM peptidoglycan-binding domain-containing protein [Flavobacteriaceae bacterium]
MYLKNSTLALLSALLYISVASGQEGAAVQIETSLTEVGITETKEKEDVFQDLPLASKWDSLWLVEVASRQDMFREMHDAVITSSDTEEEFMQIDTEVLKARLAALDSKTPFNISYNPSLESVINSFLKNKKQLIERMLTVSEFYFPLFEQELDAHDLPLEIKYLAIVESALNPRARSRVGAKGLWQFMYGTGKMYDLDVSSYVDERNDPVASTKAACLYLKKLHEIFGDWDLALAAYNSGPGNVNKAIRRSGGYENYWNIRRNLPRETAGYLPAFLATMYLFEYADEHGIVKKDAGRFYQETDTVLVKNMITFDQITNFVPVTMDDLKLLNPSYKLNIIPRVEGKKYYLRLPVSALGTFVANEKAIYDLAKEQLANNETPLPEMVKAQQKIRYRVRSGDYLGKIAERYRVGVSDIKRWNGLRSNMLRVGQRLTIYPRNSVAYATPKKSKPSTQNTQTTSGSKVHTVRKGDSLWTIARKYPGVTIEKLKIWNGISGTRLMPGTKLKLCDCSISASGQ